MTRIASTRWQRRDCPWRSTLSGVVVAGPKGALLLDGTAAVVWRLLEVPMSAAELLAAFAALDAVDELEASDPLGRLAEHDLIAEAP